ncbi:ABC transporter substrate-binding protein [Brevibacillus fluminis]|uniref:ABC transporter substrate-binding protein n=1 Tax=Brevibacillus fluminis TaxID=511487 RepID=UPI003F88AD37
MKNFKGKLIGTLAAVGLLVSACGGGGQQEAQAQPGAGTTTAGTNAQDKGEITVWAWDIAVKGLNDVIPLFNKKYPDIKVKIDEVGSSDAYDKVTAGLSAGGAGLPDAVLMESEVLPVYTSQFPDGFADLSAMGADSYKEKITATKWPQSISKGKIVAFPWDLGSTGVFYRTDIFEAAGVKAEEIETWDDFIAAGKKIKEKTGKAMLPVDISNGTALISMMLNQEGISYFDNDGDIILGSDKVTKAMAKIKEMNDAGLIANVQGWDGTVTATKNGMVATIPYGVWYSGTIMDQAPETKGKWGVFLLPAFEKGGNRASNNGGSALVIPAASKNKEIAYKFVEFALTDTEAQMLLMKKYGLFPSLLETYKDPFFDAPQEFFGNKPIFRMFADESAAIPAVNDTNDYQRAAKHVADAQAKILLSQADVKATLDEAAELLSVETQRKVKQ